MSWSYAGHLPPHRLDAGTPLDGARPGTPLGVQQPVGCTSSGASELERGEGVLLYTDGLEDAVGPGGDRFGTARVTHALSSPPDALPPVDIVDSLRRAVCDWSGRELPDDVCIVAVRAH
jgi:serine phosphatase RsbU (regulator of sigma subunit)